MEVIYAKVIALALLALLTLFFGLIPVKIYRLLNDEAIETECEAGKGRRNVRSKRRVAEMVIVGILHLGGGVLVSTCFLHMLPEVRDNFKKAALDGDSFLLQSDFPFPELVVCLGFFAIYGIEQLVHACRNSSHDHVEGDVDPGGNHCAPLTRSCEVEKQKKNVAETGFYPDLKSSEIDSIPPEDEKRRNGCKIITEASRSKIAKYGSMESIGRSFAERSGNGTITTLRGSLIVIALSLHGIFEGMAIGLQPTEVDVWTLFAAVAIHKCVIAFCVGLELMSMGSRMLTFVLNMVALAVVSPVGVATGIVIMATSSGSTTPVHDIVVGVFQGLATGTLLYVTFFEVLGKDKGEKGMRLIKFSSMILGFFIMVAIMALE